MDETRIPQVDVVEASIADVAALQVEAYVNAANNELWMGSGVAGALKRAAGAEVEREAMAQGPIAVGDAVLTSSGRMPAPAKAIVHAAAMGFTDRTQVPASRETVSQATRRALELCDEHELRSVAFPALGTGVGGLDFAECADAMSSAVAAHARAGSRIERVVFVVSPATAGAPGRTRADVFRDAIARHLGGRP